MSFLLGKSALACSCLGNCVLRCSTSCIHAVDRDAKQSIKLRAIQLKNLSILFISNIAVYNAVINFIALKSPMKFPKDETGKVLFEMQKAGVDLTVMHTVVFFHLFGIQEQAEAMAAHLAEIAPDVICDVHIDENPKVWALDCAIKVIPLYDAIVAQEAQFEEIVTQFHGHTDGWGIEA